MRRVLGILLLAYLLSGCAGARPLPGARPPFFDPQKLEASIKSYLGTPYQWGGDSRRGMDCSGLVREVFKEQGIHLPRTVKGLKGAGKQIRSFSKLRPGDLVFFSKRRFFLRKSSHLGIYLSGGRFAHASSSKGVTISNFSAYWRKRLSAARRVARTKK